MGLSGNGLAKEAGVSQATIRRYLEHYPEFFDADRRGAWPTYPQEAVAVARAIKTHLGQGLNREAVRDRLKTEFGQTIEVLPMDPERTDPPAQNLSEIANPLCEALEKVASQLETMNARLKILEDRDARIKALEDKVGSLQALAAATPSPLRDYLGELRERLFRFLKR